MQIHTLVLFWHRLSNFFFWGGRKETLSLVFFIGVIAPFPLALTPLQRGHHFMQGVSS